jgi:hypothetical protein
MNKEEVKKLIIRSLETDADLIKVHEAMEPVFRNYDFGDNFTEKVLDRLFFPGIRITRQIELLKIVNWAFPRIAFTGLAAIVLLLISLFVMEGSFSLNTILGLSESYDENVISLLTGN